MPMPMRSHDPVMPAFNSAVWARARQMATDQGYIGDYDKAREIYTELMRDGLKSMADVGPNARVRGKDMPALRLDWTKPNKRLMREAAADGLNAGVPTPVPTPSSSADAVADLGLDPSRRPLYCAAMDGLNGPSATRELAKLAGQDKLQAPARKVLMQRAQWLAAHKSTSSEHKGPPDMHLNIDALSKGTEPTPVYRAKTLSGKLIPSAEGVKYDRLKAPAMGNKDVAEHTMMRFPSYTETDHREAAAEHLKQAKKKVSQEGFFTKDAQAPLTAAMAHHEAADMMAAMPMAAPTMKAEKSMPQNNLKSYIQELNQYANVGAKDVDLAQFEQANSPFDEMADMVNDLVDYNGGDKANFNAMPMAVEFKEPEVYGNPVSDQAAGPAVGDKTLAKELDTMGNCPPNFPGEEVVDPGMPVPQAPRTLMDVFGTGMKSLPREASFFTVAASPNEMGKSLAFAPATSSAQPGCSSIDMLSFREV